MGPINIAGHVYWTGRLRATATGAANRRHESAADSARARKSNEFTRAEETPEHLQTRSPLVDSLHLLWKTPLRIRPSAGERHRWHTSRRRDSAAQRATGRNREGRACVAP